MIRSKCYLVIVLFVFDFLAFWLLGFLGLCSRSSSISSSGTVRECYADILFVNGGGLRRPLLYLPNPSRLS